MYIIYLSHAGNIQDCGRVHGHLPRMQEIRPDIPCVPCIGNVTDMPSIPYQHWHRKVYRKFCPILHQDMSWKFSTILHKDWCRIYYLSCTSIGTGKCTGNCALYYIRTCHGNSPVSPTISGHVMEILQFLQSFC